MGGDSKYCCLFVFLFWSVSVLIALRISVASIQVNVTPFFIGRYSISIHDDDGVVVVVLASMGGCNNNNGDKSEGKEESK